MAVRDLVLAVSFRYIEGMKKLLPEMNQTLLTETTLLTHVQGYYQDLLTHLAQAKNMISMTCLSFAYGQWSGRIAAALLERAAAGVQVRLMVDEMGMLTDEPRHTWQSFRLLEGLRAGGIQVDVFHPSGSGLSILNRMHCKFCAIDDRIVFLGGSNVGDDYVKWSDTNLRLKGNLGTAFHQVYGYLHQFSAGYAGEAAVLSQLTGDAGRILLTVPGQRAEIRTALLRLIEQADRSIYIRAWYFLPDPEILQALSARAASGVSVHVLISHQTRVRMVDAANYLHAHQLALNGGHVHRYTGRFMHAKAAWNNHGSFLVGSANLDPCSMMRNFEICLAGCDPRLTFKLTQSFNDDLPDCFTQTPEVYERRTLSQKLITRACSLVSAWL